MTATTEIATPVAGQEIQTPPKGGIALREDQAEFDVWQISALRAMGVEGASRADLAIFFHQCNRTQLDPFIKQIHMVERAGKWTIQTGIDGFRLIARRTVKQSGETLGYGDALWCGEDGKWTDVWLAKTAPTAAKFVVFRNGEPFSAVAVYDEFVGKKSSGGINSMWTTKASHMIAKCAEALALRKAFPQELSGLYTDDEMAQADHIDQTETSTFPSRSGRDRLRHVVIDQHQPADPAPESAPDVVDSVPDEVVEADLVEAIEPTAADIAALNAEAQADAPETTPLSSKFGGTES